MQYSFIEKFFTFFFFWFCFQSVEKKNNEPVLRYENQIIVVAENATFEFSQVLDRDFFITKISEILAKVTM